MGKVRILIVEDEFMVAEELQHQLTEQGYEVLANVDNSIDAKRALHVFQLDLVLIDIRLKGEEDGITLANHVKDHYRIPIIFISSLTDQPTIARARLCQPAAYLVKPYNQSELFIAIDMALFNFESRLTAQHGLPVHEHDNLLYHVNDHIFIKDKYRFVRIESGDILWLKAEGSYVDIITTARNHLITTETLKSFMDKAQFPNLFRVHRSYAVNIGKINGMEGNRLFIDQQEIPIGKNYHASLLEQLRIL